MATKKAGGSALAVAEGHENIAALLDEFLADDDIDNGIGDIDSADIEMPALVWNKKGMDAAGNPIAPNMYFHTGNESLRRTVPAVFLAQRKEYRWAPWDANEDRTITACLSHDRNHGMLRSDQPGIGKEGLVRACDGCPQKQWRKRPDGKREQLCFDVYKCIAVDRELYQPFIIRYKKQASRVWRSHMQKHHINKDMRHGRVRHYPLPLFEVELGLVMDVGGKYSLPTITRGRILEGQTLRDMVEMARGAREALSVPSFDFEDRDDDASERRPATQPQVELLDEDY